MVYTCDSSIDTLGPAGTCNYLTTTIAGLYSSTFTNANANIYITYGQTGLGSSLTALAGVNYNTYLTALSGENGPGTVRADAVASLPATEPALYDGAIVVLTDALFQALGLSGTLDGLTSTGGTCILGTTGCYNAIITLATPAILATYGPSGQAYWYRSLSAGAQPGNAYDFFTVVEHETDEVLGTASCVSTTGGTLSDGCDGGHNVTPSAVDLYRYNNDNGMAATPNRVLVDSTPGAYFSFTSGANNGADGAIYNTLPNGDDYADFVSNCAHVQDGTGCLGMGFDITTDGGSEINILDAVGYNLQPSGNPEVTSLTTTPNPAKGDGPITFTAMFANQNGSNYEDLVYSYMLINSSLSAANACYVVYYQPTNTFYLYNNAGTTSVGSITGGSNSTLSNGQCTLNGLNSSASGSGNTLTLTVSLTAQPSWVGTKNVYLLAEDGQAQISGWQNGVTWTPATDMAPAVGTLTSSPTNPATGPGPITFTATFVSQNGLTSTDLTWSYVLINSSLNAANACYVRYYQPTNSLYLDTNDGTALMGPITPRSANMLSNNQCTLNGLNSSAVGSGNTLTLTLSLTATPAFLGTNSVFLLAEDSEGSISGWQNKGTWMPAADTPPTVGTLSANPSPATQRNETFTITFNSQNGKPSTDLTWSYVLINTSINAANACYVRYYQPTNSLYLDTNDGTALMGPLAPGADSTLSNNQCRLTGLNSSVTSSGNTLTLVLSLTAAPPILGTQQTIFALAEDSENSISGWQDVGTWTPPIVTVRPN